MKITFVSYIISSLLSINTEHQIRLCDDNASIVEKLNLKSVQQKKSQIYYLETLTRELASRGVSVRIKVKSHNAEITVKKRFGNSRNQQISNGQTICEYDLHGDEKELSCKIDAKVDKNEFEKIRSGKKNWLDVISSEQLKFLKTYQADLSNVVIFGTLTAKRFQWTHEALGEITVDLVGQNDKEEINYNEISLRYEENDAQTAKRFEEFFKSTGVKACADQLDWPVNKFDTLQIVN